MFAVSDILQLCCGDNKSSKCDKIIRLWLGVNRVWFYGFLTHNTGKNLHCTEYGMGWSVRGLLIFYTNTQLALVHLHHSPSNLIPQNKVIVIEIWTLKSLFVKTIIWFKQLFTEKYWWQREQIERGVGVIKTYWRVTCSI